jgi:hypothetical protein
VKQIIGFRGMVIQWIANAFEKGRADGSISGIANPTLEANSALSLLEGAQLTARVVGDPAAFDAAITLLTMPMSNWNPNSMERKSVIKNPDLLSKTPFVEWGVKPDQKAGAVKDY